MVRTLFKHFRGYLGIFREIDGFIHTHRSATKEGVNGRRGATLPFLQSEKNALILEKKSPHCAHLLLKVSIQNVVLRVPRRKNSKMFPCGTIFYFIFEEMFIEVS